MLSVCLGLGRGLGLDLNLGLGLGLGIGRDLGLYLGLYLGLGLGFGLDLGCGLGLGLGGKMESLLVLKAYLEKDLNDLNKMMNEKKDHYIMVLMQIEMMEKELQRQILENVVE